MARMLASFAFATFAAGSAQAGELAPVQAHGIDLGAVAGLAYYTVEPDGYQVVATLAGDGSAAPVRLIATLLPGQKMRVSAAGAARTAAPTVEIVRRGDSIHVEPGAPAVN